MGPGASMSWAGQKNGAGYMANVPLSFTSDIKALTNNRRKILISKGMHDYISPFEAYGPTDWHIHRETGDVPEMVVTQFNSARDTLPKSDATHSFASAMHTLNAPYVVAKKTDAPLFSFNSYKKGSTRNADNVEAVYALVFDIDDLAEGFNPQSLLNAFPDCPAIVYSTHSHAPDKPKFRLVVPLCWPCPARLYKELWTILAARLPVKCDPAPSSPASIFYAPSHKPGVEFIMLSQSVGEYCMDEAAFDWINYLQDEGVVRTEVAKSPRSSTQEYETPNIFLVCERCETMRHCLETGGNVPEPYWFAALRLAVACQPDLTTELSDGYHSYNPAELEQRLQRIERETLKPTRCDYFKQHSDLCSKCHWYGRINSPCALGYDRLPSKQKQVTS